ncbi:GNAT family N-acetyltransferase [Nocardiopsis sp. N85]|uniref:GNAT family N-acetyltransferase n=1 Tax=Nocardiopsis sp. N85 TaxID=3029400 RepID=UPI00237F0189|nr:GNAT family N-acetyltransferase [Nocardiopsis sp. N85]MDE3721316.1 GNAT family N-acetyltransferase [Nocardiopsis sp. N85]
MIEGVVVDRARFEDVPAIIALLAADPLGAARESPDDPDAYRKAFEDIDSDPNQFLAVARRGERVVGTLQLTFVPGLSRRGSLRAQVEAVRVDEGERGGGLGTALMEWVEREARARGAVLLQLTSDREREDAHRFYERLGHTASHLGFKKRLT